MFLLLMRSKFSSLIIIEGLSLDDGSHWTFQYFCSPVKTNSTTDDNNNNNNINNNDDNNNHRLDIGRLAEQDPWFQMLPKLNVTKHFNGSGCFGQGYGRLDLPLEHPELTIDLLHLTRLRLDEDEKIFRWGKALF